jgi:hypothetical protein
MTSETAAYPMAATPGGENLLSIAPKVLDDQLLDVSELLVQRPNCKQAVQPLRPRFPDTNQQAGRERHSFSACEKRPA